MRATDVQLVQFIGDFNESNNINQVNAAARFKMFVKLFGVGVLDEWREWWPHFSHMLIKSHALCQQFAKPSVV